MSITVKNKKNIKNITILRRVHCIEDMPCVVYLYTYLSNVLSYNHYTYITSTV